MTIRIRTYRELQGGTADLGEQVAAQAARVERRMRAVAHPIAVMSGKGGVGKSLLAAALATALARAGHAVGLLDADLNGPSAARLLGVSGPLRETDDGVEPAIAPHGVRLMSMALLLEEGAALRWREPVDAGFVWRGAQERGAVREFLADVLWGALDVLIVDLPPGTQRLSELHELVPRLAGALAVTIPSAASADAVARSLDLARRRAIPLLGLVENFAGYRCAACGEVGPLHPGRAADDLSRAFAVPLVARVPFDPELGAAAEDGRLGAWLDAGGETAAALRELAERTAGRLAARPGAEEAPPPSAARGPEPGAEGRP